MESTAGARAFEDTNAALAVLTAEVAGAGGGEPFSAIDPLHGLADAGLDVLAGVEGSEALLAAHFLDREAHNAARGAAPG